MHYATSENEDINVSNNGSSQKTGLSLELCDGSIFPILVKSLIPITIVKNK